MLEAEGHVCRRVHHACLVKANQPKRLQVTGKKLSEFVEARHALWSTEQQPRCCNGAFGDLCLPGARCLKLTTDAASSSK